MGLLSLGNLHYILLFMLMTIIFHHFETTLSQKIKVKFLGDVEWYLRMKFDWHHSTNGSVNCHISKEGYTAAIVKVMGLSTANKSPLMTSYWSGFPVDTVPNTSMSDEARAPLIA
jgi:hypothetical protein